VLVMQSAGPCHGGLTTRTTGCVGASFRTRQDGRYDTLVASQLLPKGVSPPAAHTSWIKLQVGAQTVSPWMLPLPPTAPRPLCALPPIRSGRGTVPVPRVWGTPAWVSEHGQSAEATPKLSFEPVPLAVPVAWQACSHKGGEKRAGGGGGAGDNFISSTGLALSAPRV